MSNKPIFELDGRNLYYTFIAGANKILEHQSEINKINVFPVNDHDTGTNLASTIRSVLDNITPNRSYKRTADNIAEAALIGARGNSGIIFAQFLYGMSIETRDLKIVTIHDFAESIINSIRYIYDAIANPKEGTMLTVIKDWAEFIHSKKDIIKDFNHLFIASYEILNKSLLETKFKLAELKKMDVVDAGAKGFVVFIEGIIEFIKTKNFKKLIQSQSESVQLSFMEETIPDVIKHRFCTEAIIKNSTFDKDQLKKTLKSFGDSVVVAGSSKLFRIHVHTNNPTELFQSLKDFGTITYQKADDMIRQSEAANNRKWNIAIVTDSTCDLPPELIEHYQIHMLPINMNFGDNHYLDKLTITPDQFYKQMEESPVLPKSAQVNENAFANTFSHLATYYDAIIAVHLSDKLSGTYNSSRLAAKRISKEFNKPITVIDSNTISGPLGLVTLRTAQSIEKGNSYEKVVKQAKEWSKMTKLYVSVKTMKNLIRSGRVGHFKGFVAKLLNINPVISLDKDGKVSMFDKAFTHTGMKMKVMDHIKSDSRPEDIWNYVVLHAHSDDTANWYREQMVKYAGKEPLAVIDISPVIGMHVGIGTAAVAFLKN